jgi:hypothetical protein
MPRDHFVPRLLLQRWATNGNMVSYYLDVFKERVVENTKAGIVVHCAVPGLNDLWGVPAKAKREFESYLTKEIDTLSATIVAKMLRVGINSLTQPDRIVWAKFLVALPLRTPNVLQLLAPAEAQKALRKVQSFGRASLKEHAFANMVIRHNARMYQRNWPRRIARDLIEDPGKFRRVCEMRWRLRRLSRGSLLLGDRPLLTNPQTTRWKGGMPLDNPRCRIALPLAPDTVFFAAFDASVLEQLESMSDERLANMLNEETIAACDNFVFASDTSLGGFVKPRLTRRFGASSPD